MIPILEKPIQLIGISGHSGTGKNTIADYIIQTYTNTYQIAFADPLKYGASELFGIPLHKFYDPDLKEENSKVWGVSPRKIAQFIGTEFFRDRIAQLIPWVETDFWLHRFAGLLNSRLTISQRDDDGYALIPEFDSTDTIIIPDVRFQNEYNFILANRGLIIDVKRDGCEGDVGFVGHASEQGFTKHNSNGNWTIFNNGTLEELHNEIDKALAYTIDKFDYQLTQDEE